MQKHENETQTEFTMRAIRAEIRNEALEEAASAADTFDLNGISSMVGQSAEAEAIATAIRKLKEE